MRWILIRAVCSSFLELFTGIASVLKDRVFRPPWQKTALAKPSWSPGERVLHRYNPDLMDLFQSRFCAHIPSQEPSCLFFSERVERRNPVSPSPSLSIPTAPGLPQLMEKNASDSKSANYKVSRKCTCSAPFITYRVQNRRFQMHLSTIKLIK